MLECQTDSRHLRRPRRSAPFLRLRSRSEAVLILARVPELRLVGMEWAHVAEFRSGMVLNVGLHAGVIPTLVL
ncbi:hypothetical protein GCM10022419_094290 [Nonomuraea rosea]|uniref:Uncharacterized protein n=1 Tax=Nonomuraea rosea TaxID=638574 RepID=A0ABP6Z6W0_9ACTN